jgi:hypothetical protein
MFRTAVYGAIITLIACILSPFGWGMFTGNLPSLNLLLTLLFYACVITAGLRAQQAWWAMNGPFKWPVVIITVGILLTIGYMGVMSLLLQDSSVHNQRSMHLHLMLLSGGGIVLFSIQTHVLTRIRNISDR